jgi:hypothetical protein
MSSDPTSRTQNATLGDAIRYAGPESQITWLGDTNHNSLPQQLALMSAETVRAAAESGKKFMVVEALSNPMFEDWSVRYNKGEITQEQLDRAINTLNQPFAKTPEELQQWREGVREMFIALRENNMQLMGAERGFHNVELQAERDYPKMVELRARVAQFDTEKDPVKKAELAEGIAQWATQEIGPDFAAQYKDWYANIVIPELNQYDEKALVKALERAGDQGVLLVWGDGHNSRTHDLDEMLGERVRVVSVYPDTNAPQVRTASGSERTDLADYVFYLAEGQLGKSDKRNDISNPENVSVTSQETLEGLQNNSLMGTLIKGFNFGARLQYQETSEQTLGGMALQNAAGQQIERSTNVAIPG